MVTGSGASILNTKPARVVTRWQVNEPAVQRQYSSDHWTKLKVKTSGAQFPSQAPDATLCGSGLAQKPSLIRQDFLDSSRFVAKRSLQHGTKTLFQNTVTERQHISREAPSAPVGTHGRYMPVQRSARSSRSLYDNMYSRQARQGTIYWYRERPKPTKYGSYHFGQYKTFLGLGCAPRS